MSHLLPFPAAWAPVLGALVFGALLATLACPMEPPATGSEDSGRVARTPGSRGLVLSRNGASEGYTLFSPLLSTTTYLIDHQGRLVHTWESDHAPGASVYLLDNGHLLRCSRAADTPIFVAGGEGGRIEELTWDGDLVWDYVIASPHRVQHHDIEPLPNGNVLAIVWEHKSREQAIQAGRRPELVPERGLLPDCVLEIQPQPPRGGKFVWEWHVWDHLVQDHDPEGRNYGTVAEHPELVDVNGDHRRPRITAEILQRLEALGYIAGHPSPSSLSADLLHTNAISYNPALDQIALSAHSFGEIWVIDHSTTTGEAEGHSGGRAGKGGDLLYRWGNPHAYGRGSAEDQQLFAHHDARWIPPGLPGEGNILVFNNGYGRPGGDFSSVLELTPPIRPDRTYALSPGLPYGPARAAWTYAPFPKRSFSADFLSGAQRLANGNTFICSGPTGRFFEVTPTGEIVWEYLNPYTGDAPNPAGDPRRSVFRATRIAPDHGAIAGRRLAPVEETPNKAPPASSQP